LSDAHGLEAASHQLSFDGEQAGKVVNGWALSPRLINLWTFGPSQRCVTALNQWASDQEKACEANTSGR
jgi:hypothetical protein